MENQLTRRGNDSWVQDLAFEVALGYYSPDDLRAQFELQPDEYRDITESPAFRRVEMACRREIDEQGKQFKVLARKLATETLPELGAIALDPQASHADRISAINALAKFGHLHTEEKGAGGNTAFVVNLNLGDAGQTLTVGPGRDASH